MFEIKEVEKIEATGSLGWKAVSCLATWGGAGLLMMAVAC